MIKIIIQLFLVILAVLFPKFKSLFAIFFIFSMVVLSSVFFLGAYFDHLNGSPFWMVRNMTIVGIFVFVSGWGLGLAINRQAKIHQATIESELEEDERKR
jgi:hypothetical protein